MTKDIVLSAKRIQIKLADSEDDFERLLDFSNIYDPKGLTSPHKCTDFGKEKTRRWFFAETDKGEIIAVSSITPSIKAKSADIGYFFVRKDARSHRIGPLLLSALISYCKENYKDVDKMKIVPYGNSWWKGDKLRILDKFGFKPVSRNSVDYRLHLHFKK